MILILFGINIKFFFIKIASFFFNKFKYILYKNPKINIFIIKLIKNIKK